MKGPLVIPVLSFLLYCPTRPALGAELTGRVIVTKSLARKQVTLPVYQLRGTSPAALPAEHAEPTNEFGSVAVYLEGQSPGPEKPVRVELEQIGQRFEPQLVVIPIGSSVSFPNADPIFHNVFSLSGAKKFDLGYYPAGQTRIVKFDEPGVVQVYCHLHPNMYAAIVVVPTTWYAKPDADGTFAFHDVPPGTYHLVAWHMNAGFFRTEVRVAPAGETGVIVNIPFRDAEHVR